AVSRSVKPAAVDAPGRWICDQVSPIEIPKSGVMRLEISAEISHSVPGGTSPVFDQATVGSDISSATQGSSVASVAGKNRAPTKQWAEASERDSRSSPSASGNAHKHLKTPDITSSPCVRAECNGSASATGPDCYAARGGPLGFAMERGEARSRA